MNRLKEIGLRREIYHYALGGWYIRFALQVDGQPVNLGSLAAQLGLSQTSVKEAWEEAVSEYWPLDGGVRMSQKERPLSICLKLKDVHLKDVKNLSTTAVWALEDFLTDLRRSAARREWAKVWRWAIYTPDKGWTERN